MKGAVGEGRGVCSQRTERGAAQLGLFVTSQWIRTHRTCPPGPLLVYLLRVKCYFLGSIVPCSVPSHQHQPQARAGLCSSAGHQSGVWEVCWTRSSPTALRCLAETFQTKLRVQGKCPSHLHLFSRYKLTHLRIPDPERPQMSGFSAPPLPITQECEIPANKSLIQIRKRVALSAQECVP